MRYSILQTKRVLLGLGLIAGGLTPLPASGQDSPVIQPVAPRARGLLPGGGRQCSVEIVNREGAVSPVGNPTVFNVPISTVPVRARATCELPTGQTIVGYSNPVVPIPNEAESITEFTFDDGVRIATQLNVCQGGQVNCATSNFSIFGVGESLQLTVGAVYSSPPFETDVTAGAFGACSSTDPSVATVSADGLVTAVGPGVAAVTASVEGKIGIANIQVLPTAIDRLEVTPSSIDLELARVFTNEVSQQLRVTAVLTDASRIDVTEGSVFELPSEAQATISPTGLLTAIGDVNGTLTVTNSGATVQVPINIVSFSPHSSDHLAGRATGYFARRSQSRGHRKHPPHRGKLRRADRC